MRDQPSPLASRFEAPCTLPVCLQIRNAKSHRLNRTGCTQPRNGQPPKYLSRHSDIHSRRKIHTPEAFVLPYHLSCVCLQTGMDAECHRRHLCSRFFFRTCLVCAEINRTQARRPKLRQVSMRAPSTSHHHPWCS